MGAQIDSSELSNLDNVSSRVVPGRLPAGRRWRDTGSFHQLNRVDEQVLHREVMARRLVVA